MNHVNSKKKIKNFIVGLIAVFLKDLHFYLTKSYEQSIEKNAVVKQKNYFNCKLRFNSI